MNPMTKVVGFFVFIYFDQFNMDMDCGDALLCVSTGTYCEDTDLGNKNFSATIPDTDCRGAQQCLFTHRISKKRKFVFSDQKQNPKPLYL